MIDKCGHNIESQDMVTRLDPGYPMPKIYDSDTHHSFTDIFRWRKQTRVLLGGMHLEVANSSFTFYIIPTLVFTYSGAWSLFSNAELPTLNSLPCQRARRQVLLTADQRLHACTYDKTTGRRSSGESPGDALARSRTAVMESGSNANTFFRHHQRN